MFSGVSITMTKGPFTRPTADFPGWMLLDTRLPAEINVPDWMKAGADERMAALRAVCGDSRGACATHQEG